LDRPRTLRDALRRLAAEPLEPVAGCTDVYVGLQFGTVTATRFLDLWGLDELRGIRSTGGGLRLGALTTYADLIRSRLVRARVPMLVAAAREVGGAQIQNRGTIGGNLANASPAGDTLPVLAAAGARVVLVSESGERAVPVTEFYTGYRATVRRADELIAAVEIPPIDGRQWWRKVGTRRAQAISKVMMAGVRGGEVRIALGAVAPTVVLAVRAGQILSAGGAVADAQAALAGEIAPIDDLRSTSEYRRTVAVNLLARFWSDTA
jgi:CO/xanthine dehydrogenase FAD-binding subunit